MLRVRPRHQANRLQFESLETRYVLATFTVTSPADSGAGSLRDAIQQANAAAAADLITFDAALDGQTISILSELSISDSVSIDASSLASLTIDASAGDMTPGNHDGMGIRAFTIDDGSLSSLRTVSLHGLTITGGDATGRGGGIRSAERLELTNSVVTGNHATLGGGGVETAFYSEFVIDSSEIIGNEAGGFGAGGISISGGDLFDAFPRSGVIKNSLIAGNNPGGVGANVSLGFDLEILDSEVAGNTGGSGLRVFSSSDATLTVARSTFRDNIAFEGGGITLRGLERSGQLVVTDSVVQGNSAFGFTGGGGISVDIDDGEVRIQNTAISDNTASDVGGGIRVSGSTDPYSGSGSSSVAIYGGSIHNNVSDGSGGGIGAELASHLVRIVGTSITSNSSAARGGGISFDANNGKGAEFLIRSATISGNNAGEDGGGIHIGTDTRTFRMRNSTLSGNRSDANGGGIAATYFPSGYIRHSTIADNTASQMGGGIFAMYDGPQLSHTIVADNAGAAGMNPSDDIFGSANSDFSLIESIAGGSINGADNLVGIDAGLGPLADNGGPTRTMALLPGSPAIDVGDPTATAGSGLIPLFDQRDSDFPRIFNDRIDIGAFEYRVADGDFDNDGEYDCNDIDALVAEIATGMHGIAFDLNADTLVNLLDLNTWLAEAGSANLGPGNTYQIGDANLDGFVDGSDFLIWSKNKFTPIAAWCSADFNADGIVDGFDFLEWNSNRAANGQGTPPLYLPADLAETGSINLEDRLQKPTEMMTYQPLDIRPDMPMSPPVVEAAFKRPTRILGRPLAPVDTHQTDRVLSRPQDQPSPFDRASIGAI